MTCLKLTRDIGLNMIDAASSMSRDRDAASGRKLRILFVLDGLVMGGAERNAIQLIETLLEAGHTPELCTLSHTKTESLAQRVSALGIPLHELGTQRIYDPRGAARFVRLLNTRKFDCIHVQDSYAHVIAMVARWRCQIPAIMTQHTEPTPGETIWDHTRASVLFAAAARAYDHAILVAGALQTGFEAATGIAAGRISIVHNGVRLKQPAPDLRQKTRAALGLPDTAELILLPAVLRAGKGHDVLLDAMPQITQARPNAHLVFAGDGPLRAKLAAMAATAKGHVQMLGQRDDIEALMAAAEVIVLPSLSEALPTVLLEAAAAARPVVASNVGGVPEIVDEGETGHMVPPRDPQSLAKAIVAVLGDPDRAQRMGRMARQKAERDFSLKTQADQTVQIYRKVVDRVALAH